MKVLLLLFTSILLLANTNDELNFLEDLNNASKIATRTKLNINKSPAVVSIIHANDLKKIGITNLYSALGTLPGIEISMGTSGAKQINMRGNKSLIRDKIKLMIDGISVNAEVTGASYIYLDMPIENIQRIEVIRGPASALYGSFAHIGVINVITKNSTHKNGTIFANTNSQNLYQLGFTQHFNVKDIKISFNGSLVENKNSRKYSSFSLLPNQNFTSYENYTNSSFGTSILFNNSLTLNVKYTKLNTQNYLGYGDWPIASDPKRIQSTSLITELLYTPKISDQLSLDIKVGHKKYIFEGVGRLRPKIVLSKPFDLLGDGYYKEEVLYSDFTLKYETLDNYLLFGVLASKAVKKKSSYLINNPATSETTNISFPFIKKDITREQYALYINDIYSLSKKWTLNAGMRYDYFNDVDLSFVPKLAMLYNHNEEQSYKLMYQRSFRVPAFIELYGLQEPFKGDKNLKSGTIDTIELSYRYQNSFDSWFNINFFYSDMKNFIDRNANFELFNGVRNTSYGTEIEVKFPILQSTSLQTNYSYVDIEDVDNHSLAFVANHLANAMLSHQINSNLHTGTLVKYVGKRTREKTDTRKNLSHYTTFDQTITYTHNDFSIQASAKNIFNDKVLFPTVLGNGSTSGTYLQDITQDGRTFLLSLEWRFE